MGGFKLHGDFWIGNNHHIAEWRKQCNKYTAKKELNTNEKMQGGY